MARHKIYCSISFDFDGMSSWIAGGTNNPSMISRGEFGAVAIPRILDVLDRFGVTSSFAVPGHTAYAWPDLVRSIAERGHEIVHHGWVHENPAAFDREGEKEKIERGLEALQHVLGVKPSGYRSPAWNFSPHTLSLLREYGFSYDSSCMAHDCYPYYLREGDRWSQDEAFSFGDVVDLVEVPVSWGLDDFPVSEFVPGVNAGLQTPAAIEAIWQGDFDYMQQHYPGALYNLTLHPQTIGRGHRMLMLERLLRYFSAAGAHFVTMGDYVQRWKSNNPLAQWCQENPTLTGCHAITTSMEKAGDNDPALDKSQR